MFICDDLFLEETFGKIKCAKILLRRISLYRTLCELDE